MPLLTHAVPRYRRHASGQAIVEFNRRVHYLGVYDSAESRREYDRLVGEWLSSGRQPLTAPPQPREKLPPGPPVAQQATAAVLLTPKVPISVVELAAKFWDHAQKHYVRHGRPTGTHDNYRPCLRMLKEVGALPVHEFGPRMLKRLVEQMVASGQSRRYVNDNLSRIRKVFRWGVSEEYVTAEQLAALRTVEQVAVGAAGVSERAPVTSVSNDMVAATLPCLPPVVRAMVQLARLTGARPGEICALRPCDVDTSQSPWVYRPARHKTEHHGKQRQILIGPRGQKILKPYLARRSAEHCFSPAESEDQRRTSRGGSRRIGAQRRPGTYYTNDSFRRAITRACDRAFPPPKGLSQEERLAWQLENRWSPNQLRHAAATEICSQFSITAAKETLGHASVRTTERYLDPDLAGVKKVMEALG